MALNTYTTPFLKMRPAEQREVIEELLGIGQISQLAEQLKMLMDEHKETLRNEEAMVAATRNANARIDAAIAQARDQATNWETAQNRLLTELGERATRLSDIDIEAELRRFDEIDAWHQNYRVCHEQANAIEANIIAYESNISRARKDLLRYESDLTRDSGEVSRLQQQIIRLRDEASQSVQPQIDRLLAEAERQRSNGRKHRNVCENLLAKQKIIEGQLAAPDAHHCSVCGQGLSGTDHLATVLAALQEEHRALGQQIEQEILHTATCDENASFCEHDAQDVQSSHTRQQNASHALIAELEAEIATIQDRSEQQRKTASEQAAQMRDEIARLQADLDQERPRLKELLLIDFGIEPVSQWESRDTLWRVRQERDKLFAQLESEMAKTNPVQDKIDGLIDTLTTIDYSALNTVTEQLKHEQFLYKLLTSKDSFIRKRIIDQNLPYLNKSLNHYLHRLGLPHEIRFVPDLTVEISLLGDDYDFESLSRGEANRVNLATSFSFRDLWQNLNQQVNLLIIDECLDQGTDRAGIEAAVILLQELSASGGKNIFLISHREELKDQMDNVLLATKENRFTCFTEMLSSAYF
jgi:chromosome segregation ATPase